MTHGQSTDSISLKEETLSCHDEDLVSTVFYPINAQCGSTPDLKLLTNMSEFMTHGQSTKSISLKEEMLS